MEAMQNSTKAKGLISKEVKERDKKDKMGTILEKTMEERMMEEKTREILMEMGAVEEASQTGV